MKKFSSAILSFSFFLFVFLFNSQNTYAWQVKREDTIHLPATQTFNESVVLLGNDLMVDSKIDGDLICAGRKIVITGEVTGDVLCAGQILELTGKVGGNVRIAGQELNLQNSISKNANLFGQDIVLGETAIINGEITTAASKVTLNGKVLKSWDGVGEDVVLNGSIGGDTNLITDTFSIGQKAVLAGPLVYESEQEVKIANGAKLNKIQRNEKSEKTDSNQNRARHLTNSVKNKLGLIGKTTGLISGLAFGLIAVLLFGNRLQKSANLITSQSGKSLTRGLIIWILGPISILITLITIIGIPIAFFLALCLFILNISAHIVTALALGEKIVKKSDPVKRWFVGFVVITISSWLPIIGWLVSTVSLLLGSGAITLSFSSHKATRVKK